MDTKPSWQKSTLSQAFIISLVFYMLILLIISAGLIWVNLDVEKAKIIVGWASVLQGGITTAYLTARKVNGEAKHEEASKP